MGQFAALLRVAILMLCLGRKIALKWAERKLWLNMNC